MSMNVSCGVCLIVLADLYMCMQKHYKHNDYGRTVPGVGGHGSVPISTRGTSLQKLDYNNEHHCENNTNQNVL